MLPELCIQALQEVLGEGHEYVKDHNGWPDEPYGESVAEYTPGLLIAGLRHSAHSYYALRDGK